MQNVYGVMALLKKHCAAYKIWIISIMYSFKMIMIHQIIKWSCCMFWWFNYINSFKKRENGEWKLFNIQVGDQLNVKTLIGVRQEFDVGNMKTIFDVDVREIDQI